MSIDSLTPDDFMKLTASHHELAINLYDEKIADCKKQISESADPVEAEQLVAEWSRSATIRKIHVAALDELQSNGSTEDPA